MIFGVGIPGTMDWWHLCHQIYVNRIIKWYSNGSIKWYTPQKANFEDNHDRGSHVSQDKIVSELKLKRKRNS
jgi:hypothetical protein